MNQPLNAPKKKYTPIKGESFIAKSCLARSEQKRELHKLMLAQCDIDGARKTCEHLLTLIGSHTSAVTGSHAGVDHPLYYPLMEAIVISYARPFVNNDRLGQLKKHWATFSNKRFQTTHVRILAARNELVAHSDPFVRQVKIVPPGAKRFDNKSKKVGFAINRYMFTLSEIVVLRDAALDVSTRLLAEVERLLDELYADMDLPKNAFTLRLDDGL